jgi:hypothetical protein
MPGDYDSMHARPPAGWLLYALAAWVACSVAGVLLDLRLHANLLPYRWGPKENVSTQMLRGDDAREASLQLRDTARQGGAIALGTVAGLLALAFGLIDAVQMRSKASFALAPLGLIIGAAGGAVGGFVGIQLGQQFEAKSNDLPSLTESIMLQAASWSIAGLGVALAVWVVSLGRRRFFDTLIGGLLAGGVVGAVYPNIASILFADDHTERLFPDRGYFPPNAAFGYTGAFLFWVMFTGVAYAVILGSTGRRTPKTSSTD